MLYPGRMRSDTLTGEQIVEAATDPLDSEGREGLNPPALGKRLGSAATALRRRGIRPRIARRGVESSVRLGPARTRPLAAGGA